MRTVNQLPIGIPRDADLAKFPDSTVVNETENNEGTPVVREIYGDILTNIYKILRLTKTTANGNEDNELNGYQLVNALRKFTNELNDIEQQLNLSGSVFSVNIDLDLLPNRYVMYARSVEDYVAGPAYTFKGSGATAYPLTAVMPFKSGDLVLLVIDSGTVRAYNINPSVTANTDVFTPFGTPLAFNDSAKLYYQSEGVLFSDVPETNDLQGAIRLLESDGTILVYEMILAQGYVYCLAFTPATLTYKMYRFAVTALNTPLAVSLVGASFPTGVIANDYKPNLYSDGVKVYISNQSGNSANNYAIDIFTIAGANLNFNSSINLDASFDKTTNVAIKGSDLFTLVNGVLYKYNLTTGVKTFVGSYPTFLGILFGFKNQIYFSGGDVAKAWNL
jgi:hypothetical protein